MTAITLLLFPSFSLAKMMPFVKEPPTQAIAAIPIGSPESPSIAVRAIELSGEVQIIFIIPPRRKPITIGDCSVAAVMVPPMRVRRTVTTGSDAQAMRWAKGAIKRAPRMIFNPYETPIGVFTALIGIPFFISVARKERG